MSITILSFKSYLEISLRGTALFLIITLAEGDSSGILVFPSYYTPNYNARKPI